MIARSGRVSRFSTFILRNYRWIIVLSLILSTASSYFAVRLYKNLRTDMEELLPSTARSVRDLSEVTGRVQSSQSLAILVFSRDVRASKRFVTDLSKAVEDEHLPQIARVEYRIGREIRFFRKHRALYVELSDLERLRKYIHDRIRYEMEIRNPLNIFSGKELAVPAFDFRRMERRYSQKVSPYTRFPDGFYASRDQTIRVILVFLKSASSGITNAQKLMRGVESAVRRLDPKAYAPDIEVKYTGDVANFVEEHASLIGDLEFSTVIVVVLVTLALLIFYRDFYATLALLISLFAGTLWTFGIAYFLVGYLNANTAFLGSIVIGNGINFGIIFLARYMEERRGKKGHLRAIHLTVSGTTTATLAAALSAGLSYGSLMLTEFRGFKQFGTIGLIGMILCWISAFTVMPALLYWIERWKLLGRGIGPKRSRNFSAAVSVLIGRFHKPILMGSLLLLALSGLAAATYHGRLIETDTTKLRDKRSVQSGSAYLSIYLDRIFGRYLSPLVVLADSGPHMDQIAEELKAYQARYGHAGLIAGVYTIHDFVPRDQPRKITILKDIKGMLKPKIMARLSPRDRMLARELLKPESLRPIGVRDLPPLVLDRFRLRDGSIGNLIVVEPVVDEPALAKEENQFRVVNELRKAADSVQPGAPVVGTLPVTVDMYESVRKDGPRATLFAFLAVVLLVVLLFHRLRTIFQALLALILGVSWLSGIVLAVDLKVNFLNFIALPITFGIGVDYGANILQRYRIEGVGSILRVVRESGGAVTLASLTTMIGYGSLLLAGNQAFFSFGRLAILGEITCLMAAILSLPAYLYLLDSRSARIYAIRQKKTDEELRKTGT